MDTSLIVLKLDPKWVSVRIKGKLLQLRLEDEVNVAESKSERSQTTGRLAVRLRKMRVNELVLRENAREKEIARKKREEE
jgi:protein TilB